MLTRLVRIQLMLFSIASIIALVALVFSYLQVPTLLGIGRLTVTLELPATGGLYQFSNVTYRGVQIGKVTEVTATREGAKATLSLDTSPKIPADVQAAVRSVSAVGEQYVDLRPRSGGPPYLRNGAVIAMRDISIPQRVGPMLDRMSALLNSIPKGRISGLLDESFRGFNGAGDDMGSVIDSSSTFTSAVDAAGDRPRALIADSEPLLQSQADTADAIRTWTHSLADVTEQLTADDGHVRTLLQTGPPAAQEVARLLDQVKPTLPVLLANLTSVGKIGVTYNASLEQLLVLLPPFVSAVQSALPGNNPTGIAIGEFRISMGDPPACTVGYLPPSSWRSPADTSEVDTPDGLYCKLPQDSPIAVRGARNYPCMGHPGKRAPTVQICDSEQPFEPVAQRQHALGPYPLDPNLVAQGVPPDDRVDFGDRIFGPTEGTPPPPEVPAPAETPPAEAPAPAPETPSAAPSSATATEGAPSVAIAQYSPSTGQFVTPDGHAYRQSDLVSTPRTWTDMLPLGG